MIAAEFSRMTKRIRTTMAAAALSTLKPSCGLFGPCRDHNGHRRETIAHLRHVEPARRVGDEAGDRADQKKRGSFAGGPGDREKGAGEDSGGGVGKDVILDDFPLGGTNAEPGLSEGAGHRTNRLLGLVMITTGSTSADRVRPPARGCASSGDGGDPPALDEDGQPEDAVHDAGHSGEVADVEFDEAGEPIPGCVLLQVDRGRDPEWKGDDGDDEAEVERAFQTLTDADCRRIVSRACR